MDATLVEQEQYDGAYGMVGTRAIVKTEDHGRLLITDGYGPVGVRGEMYRWELGIAQAVPVGATLETLFTYTDGVCPADRLTPIPDITGDQIHAIAKAVGLA